MIKISIITAVFNAKETIDDAISSVICQSYNNIELIVIDGASNDGTLQILDDYKDNFAHFTSSPDDGIYSALNKGISYASGDVIGFLHADDLFADHRVLEKIGNAFIDPAIDVVYGDLVYVSKKVPDKIIRYWAAGDFLAKKLKSGWMPPHPSFYVRRSVYEDKGVFDTSFRIAADYDCILRFLGDHKINCVYIPHTFVRMRIGGISNRSLINIILKSKEDYKALRKNNVGGLWALIWKNIRKVSQFFH